MQRSPAITFLAFLLILTSAVLTLVFAENLKTFKSSSQQCSIETTNHPVKGPNYGGTEGALAMTYHTPPALEAASLPPGVQLSPSSAPAVHPHYNTQGGEKIPASTSMTTEEKENTSSQNDNDNNDPDNNDVSASTTDIKPSSSLTTTTTRTTTTTTTTMATNDCSQEVEEEIMVAENSDPDDDDHKLHVVFPVLPIVNKMPTARVTCTSTVDHDDAHHVSPLLLQSTGIILQTNLRIDASTADVASSSLLTTTTTTTANDCSQVRKGAIEVMENSSKSPTTNEATRVASSTASSREGRCEKFFFSFLLLLLIVESILYFLQR